MSWIDTTVGEFCPFIYGKGLPKTKRQAGEYPVYGSNGCVDFHNDFYIDGPGIIIGRKGSVGAAHLSTQPFWPIDTAFYVTKGTLGELRFTYYLLKSLGLEKMNSDSAVPGLNRDNAHALSIRIPESPESRESLGNQMALLDEKIAANSGINQTLEEMAQAIFKSWFVDFDPVKAKMNGEQPEGMNAATASLFPEKLVESELGLIPEGWEIHKTQDLFDVKDGTHDSPKKAEEGHYLVTSKHITKGKIDTSSAYLISDADFEKVNQRSKVDTFDILLTMIGTVGEVVVVYDNPVEFAIKNVGLFKTSQRPELVWLFYWHLQSFKMKHYLEVRMAGTTQQYLTLKTLRTIPVVLPSEELLAKFNEVMSPLMEKISDNHKQNQTLSNLRDTLLPKLLSGEIELGSSEELVEAI
ncbi:restriction endonuclease subunit S [Vibrio vulnificus]|nr:restriction endonuclease subunit S [Vibrio vulnificus]